jgi:protein MpaA
MTNQQCKNMNSQINIIGHSALGLPIVSYEWGLREYPAVLIIAGVHGNEIEGVTLAWLLLEEWQKNFAFKLNIHLIPQFNPDGILLKTRSNANNVDLNRNLPTKDWTPIFTEPKYNPGSTAASEPENIALIELIKTHNFSFIFSLHSWSPLINVNGDCTDVAKILNHWTQYKIEPDMGYPTPGCLGTFTGKELNIPTITYEIERGISLEKIKVPHLQAYLEALKYIEEKNSKNSNLLQ